MRVHEVSERRKIGLALLLATIAALGLYTVDAASAHRHPAFSYLPWNIGLAWLALGISVGLERLLQSRLWSSWLALATTAMWLLFLPNTFYMLSDFVHLADSANSEVLLDTLLFCAFIFPAMIMGYLGVFIIHLQLRQRVEGRTAAAIIAAVLLGCSFAIYIGRELRWNSWDVLTSPLGLLFDVSDRIINPHAHPQAFAITASTFIFLGVTYLLVWHIAMALAHKKYTRL